tara:strand:- start:286 stop:492 length:207 start_codon:yes stop_codon:yes gene_type:complete
MCKKNYVGSIHNGLKSNKARLANKRASAKMIAVDCTSVAIGDLAIPCFDTLKEKHRTLYLATKQLNSL